MKEQQYISVDFFNTGNWECRIPCARFTPTQRQTVRELLTESQYLFNYVENQDIPYLFLTKDSIKTVVDTLWPYTARWIKLEDLRWLRFEFEQVLPIHKIGAFFGETCTNRPNPMTDDEYSVFLACDTEENAVLLNLACTSA